MSKPNITQALTDLHADDRTVFPGMLRNVKAGGNLKELIATYKRQTAEEFGWLYARLNPARRQEFVQDVGVSGFEISFNLDMLGTPNTMGKRGEVCSHG